MKDQLQAIREALDRATRYTMLEPDAQAVQQALTALDQIEAMAGYPVAWGMQHTDGAILDVISPEEHAREEGGYVVPLYRAAPVAQQPQARRPPFKEWTTDYVRENLHKLKQPQAEAVRAKLGKEKVMNDPYASEADTKALLQRDTRTPAEKKLDQMLDERWANEQGVDAVGVLRQIAIELIAQQAEAVPSDVVRDGERYRWLRVCNLNKFDFVQFAFEMGDQHLDNAIDLAMAQGVNHG